MSAIVEESGHLHQTVPLEATFGWVIRRGLKTRAAIVPYTELPYASIVVPPNPAKSRLLYGRWVARFALLRQSGANWITIEAREVQVSCIYQENDALHIFRAIRGDPSDGVTHRLRRKHVGATKPGPVVHRVDEVGATGSLAHPARLDPVDRRDQDDGAALALDHVRSDRLRHAPRRTGP